LIREITDRDFKELELSPPGTPNAKTPKSDFSGSRATCPPDDRWLWTIWEISIRDSKVHATLASPNTECRNPDMMGSLDTRPSENQWL
jgi:hypothetical protein